MCFLYKSLLKLAIVLVFLLIPALAFAAGDYVWEAQFAKELPKAEQGDVKAQYAVGEMYERGRGAVFNLKEAFKWYVKAASNGDIKAAYKVGLFYYDGTAVSKDYNKARTWFTKAAEKGYVRAQYHLGEIYEKGHGVTSNYDSALKWYKSALAGGYNAAADAITRVASAQSKKADAIKTRQRAASTVAINPVDQTIERLLKGGWKKRKRPVEYLPSSVNKCKRTNKSLECESSLLKRDIGMADISYTTKAIIYGFKSDGQFKVSYRNNVKSIKVTDEDFAEEGGKVPVKLGWQDAEHKLVCEVEDSNSIACTKNKARKFKLTR